MVEDNQGIKHLLCCCLWDMWRIGWSFMTSKFIHLAFTSFFSWAITCCRSVGVGTSLMMSRISVSSNSSIISTFQGKNLEEPSNLFSNISYHQIWDQIHKVPIYENKTKKYPLQEFLVLQVTIMKPSNCWSMIPKVDILL